MAFNLSGALAGLSGVEGGYQEGMANQYKLDEDKRQALAKLAMGRALGMLSGGGQGAMPGQSPMVQPMQPGQSPMVQPMQPGQSPMVQPMQPGQSPMVQPMQPGQSPMVQPMQPGQSPMGGPGRAPMGPSGMGGIPSQGQQPGLPQGFPQGQAGQQPLDWRQLVQAVKQANPNLPPDVMAEAVNQFLPMMNAQSQQEWRQISLQLREQALQQSEQNFILAQGGRKEQGEANRLSRETIAKMNVDERTEAYKAGLISKEDVAEKHEAAATHRTEMTIEAKSELAMLSNEAKQEIEKLRQAGKLTYYQMTDATKREIAKLHDDTKRELFGAAEAGRNARSSAGITSREGMTDKRLGQQQQQFEVRESRLNDALEFRKDTTYQRLQQASDAAMQRVKDSQGKQGLAQARAAIDAQDKHVRTRIMAYSQTNTMDDAERKQLLDQADMDYNQQIGRLKQMATGAGGVSTPGGAPAGGSPGGALAGGSPGGALAGGSPGGATPTLQQFLEKARAANPGVSDADLTTYYHGKYGG